MQAFVLPQVIFYVFATLTLFAAFMVITQNNPVRSVLFLVLAFITSAVLWLLVKAEFLALVLILVYVGAVMTLFLFVVMMLNIDIETLATKKMRYLPFGLIVIAGFVALVLKVIPSQGFQVAASALQSTSNITNTEALGLVLYTDYWVAFELAALILLVAIVAAITLVHRVSRRSKRQDVVKQMLTHRDERLTMVQMQAEK